MKYAFFGTPRFASILLKRLIGAGLGPKLLVCNPDRPAGRGRIITPPPTKIIAERNNIRVLQPEKLVASEIRKELEPLDFAVVAAYSKIIRDDVLALPKKGFFGIHPSLLPKYRGASPIQSVILAGEKKTGVTIYKIDTFVDHGPILLTNNLELTTNETYETLEEKLAELGAKMLIELMLKITEGKVTLTEQNHAEATMTKKFETKDGFVDLEKDDVEMIVGKVRALNPDPGVWTNITPNNHFLIRANKKVVGKRVKILDAKIEEGELKLKVIQVEGEKPKAVKI